MRISVFFSDATNVFASRFDSRVGVCICAHRGFSVTDDACDVHVGRVRRAWVRCTSAMQPRLLHDHTLYLQTIPNICTQQVMEEWHPTGKRLYRTRLVN